MTRIAIVFALVTAFALGACRGGHPARHGQPGAVDERLAEEARIILETHCGACHTGEFPSALPAALDIFDLSRVDWYATIEPRHHAGILGRLSTADMDLSRPTAAPDVDIARVRQFLLYLDAARTPPRP